MSANKTDPASAGSSFAPIVAIVASLVLMALLLWLEGRMAFCSCGEFRVWSGDTCSSNNSQQLFDPYSFTHVLHGFLLFWLVALLVRRVKPAWQLWLALTLEAAWEVFENTRFVIERYRAETAALGYTGDTIVNSFGDLTCAVVGFLVARKLGLLRSLIVFLVLELILVVWIHDSLLLQLLMLIHPVEAIKQWQMCR
jgi:hypothetical protein